MAKIFAIDDDHHLLDLVSMTLSKADHEVVKFDRPGPALEELKQNKPDLVVVDVMMPGMSGHEFCRRVRADATTQDLPIMVLTARSQAIDKAAALSSGADSYMSKPFTAQELVDAVNNILSTEEPVESLPKVGIIISMFSMHGGAGQTTLAVNLAAALRHISNRPVCLVDMSPSVGQVTTHLRLRTRKSWLDLTRHENLNWDIIKDTMIKHQSGLHVLASPPVPVSAVKPSYELTKDIFKQLYQHALFTVVDMPPGLNPAAEAILELSDLIFHVVAPEFTSVRIAAKSNIVLAEEPYKSRQKVHVLNHIAPDAQLPVDAIEKALNARIAFEVGYDMKQPLALAQGEPLPMDSDSSPMPMAVRRIATVLWNRIKTGAQ